METYENILKRMTEKYRELSGNTPHEASDIAIRLRVLAGEIYSSLVNIEWLKRQMFADTAEGVYLDYHAQSRGLSRRGASRAVGEVIFSITEPTAVPLTIPVGTVVATGGETPLRFETLETVVIPVGGTSIHADVKALSTGRAYNVAEGAVSVIVTPPAGVEFVTNPDPFTSGSDEESDEKLRIRIIDSFKNVSNGTNCAYYENIATQVAGITGAGVVPRSRGAGTVDVYVAGDGTEVSDEQVAEAQKLLSTLREVNVDVKVLKAEPVYAKLHIRLDVKDGYEFDEVKDKCIYALNEYISTRGVGGNVLLTEAGERIIHVDGVKEYMFTTALNGDLRLEKNQYPVTGTISITEGVAW